MRFGIHAPITGGFDRSIAAAQQKGCEAMQIFCKNPRGWKANPIDESQLPKYREARASAGITPVIIHTSYLVNLAASKDDIYIKSVESFGEELIRADLLEAEYIVLHPGSHSGWSREESLERLSTTLIESVSRIKPKSVILLENVSGSGSAIGGKFSELAEIIMATGMPECFGICLDTCHAFGYGYDLSTVNGLDAVLQEIDETVGLEKLKLIHMNDSKGELGSRLDRHDHIGMGKIGLDGFRGIINHKELRDLPAILETPEDEPGDDIRNLQAVRSLVNGSLGG